MRQLAGCHCLYYNKGQAIAMRLSFEEQNLDKHDVTLAEVKEVLESDLSYAEDLDPSDRGHDRAMIIGWTFSGRILEIGIEYFDDIDEEHIFHAMDAGKQYKREFLRRSKN